MRYFAAAILCCISAFAQAPPPQPANIPAPNVKPEDKCSVEGTVVSAITGAPLNRARLILQPIGGPHPIPYGTTTDSAGHFVFDEVDAGRYDLAASRSGYLMLSYSPQGNARQSTTIALERGQKLKEIVFKLVPQGAISGRILDEYGEPLDNVAVECMSVQYERGKRQLVGQNSSNTNDLGEFRLAGLTPGRYVIKASYQSQNMYRQVQERPVRAQREGQAPEEGYTTTYYPNATNPNSASGIELTAGAQIDGINMTLIRARTFHLKGRLRMSDATLSRRTLVSLYPREEMQSGMPSMTAVVDPQGKFQMSGVAPGSYLLYASSLTDGKRSTARLAIEVGNSNIEGIDLTLQPPLEVQGRLIVEAKGDLKGAMLNLQFRPRTPGVLFAGGFAQVKDDLSFKVPNAGLDTYDLHVNPLPENFYLKAIRIGPEDVTETGIDLTQGVPPEELTVVLNPNGGVIEGTVKNAKDEPATGATVTLIPDAAHQSLTWLFKIGNTDQNGHFVIQGVRPGGYKIYAWEEMQESAYEDPDFVKPHESAGEALEINEGARESVQLKAIPAETTANQTPGR